MVISASGGPVLSAVPAITMDINPTNQEMRRLVNEARSIERETKDIISRFGMEYPWIQVCTRQSRYYPEMFPIPTMLVIARREKIDNS